VKKKNSIVPSLFSAITDSQDQQERRPRIVAIFLDFDLDRGGDGLILLFLMSPKEARPHSSTLALQSYTCDRLYAPL
jgi:hypothetical protein